MLLKCIFYTAEPVSYTHLDVYKRQVLNLFGIVVATCMIYNMEFKGSAVKKMSDLPYGRSACLRRVESVCPATRI